MKNLLLTLLAINVVACSGQSELSQQTPPENSGIAVLIKEAPAYPMGPCEPSIAINLSNPANIVAGSILDRVYYSNDSGKTWVTDDLQSSYGVWGDPVIVSDAKGRFLFFHLSDPTGKNWASEEILDRIVCQWSDDGGENWSDGSYMGLDHPKDQDKEWAAVDLRNNNVYCTWTQFDDYGSEEDEDQSNILFSMSSDGGENWSKAVQINEKSGGCLDDDNTTEGAVPSVGPDGEVYVAWALSEEIWFDKSLDGGQTWLEKDIKVADQPGGWDVDIPGIQRSNGMPVTGCDVSEGPNRGTVYVVWSDQRVEDDPMDIWIAKSTDKGETWSEPIKVNQDETNHVQFLPWLAVDPVTGDLHVVFYDRRAHDDDNTDVYVASSSDGGNTWTEQRVNDESFLPVEFVFFGDYNNISAYNGMVRPIWTEYRGGKLQVWTALMD
ncbi:sialidase family protein [Phaeocystidibacter luteus]|uniref:Exo-alpha-sialidase n=1 Tax=Phaeocystidibacter luteus TaxID=911197 RepID=A0A6N6REB6_9FLAO|nr:sialidase family protein [Phaeocystidibacter luteus]KAB2808083.1 exo-alpha-sialidase [Phaeocystidibacter luteus]